MRFTEIGFRAANQHRQSQLGSRMHVLLWLVLGHQSFILKLWTLPSFRAQDIGQSINRLGDIFQTGEQRCDAKAHDIWCPKIPNDPLRYKSLHTGIAMLKLKGHMAAALLGIAWAGEG